MVKEKLITEREALLRIDPHQMQYFLHPMIDPTYGEHNGWKSVYLFNILLSPVQCNRVQLYMYPLYVCLIYVNCNCTGNESDAFIAQRILGKGIAASPGAAIGKVAFSTEQVQEYHAKQEACILVKAETSAEDVAALKVSLRLSDSSCVITSELMIPCVLLPRTRSL